MTPIPQRRPRDDDALRKFDGQVFDTSMLRPIREACGITRIDLCIHTGYEESGIALNEGVAAKGRVRPQNIKLYKLRDLLQVYGFELVLRRVE